MAARPALSPAFAVSARRKPPSIRPPNVDGRCTPDKQCPSPRRSTGSAGKRSFSFLRALWESTSDVGLSSKGRASFASAPQSELAISTYSRVATSGCAAPASIGPCSALFQGVVAQRRSVDDPPAANVSESFNSSSSSFRATPRCALFAIVRVPDQEAWIYWSGATNFQTRSFGGRVEPSKPGSGPARCWHGAGNLRAGTAGLTFR